jgi:hypothetical protein
VSHTNLTAIPERFAAGTTVEYTKSFSEYPADQGWAVTLWLAGPSGATSFAGTPTGSSFAFALTAALTAGLIAGGYEWKEVASKSGKKYTADSGKVELLPDIEAAGAGDLQSFAEKMIAVIKAEIQRRVTGGMQSYQIHGRAAVLYTLDDLHKLLAKYEADVRLEKSGAFGTPVRMQFTGTAAEESP